MALLLLFIGAWASIATSPAETSVQEEGTHVFDVNQPVVQISWVTTSDKSASDVRGELWWAMESETGKVPQLSVALLGEPQGRFDGGPATSLSQLQPEGTVELVVTNLEQTGPVTLTWGITGRVEEEQAKLELTVTTEAGAKPSAQILLPEHWRYFNDLEQVATVYTIIATTPAADVDQPLSIEVEPLESGDQPSEVVASVIVDGTPADFEQRIAVPWPGSCGNVCEREVELVLTAPPAVKIDAGNTAGTVTAVAREPFRSEPVWIDVKPFPALSEERVYILDIELASGDPLDRQVVFASEVVKPATEFGCNMAISFRSIDGSWGPETRSIQSDWTSNHPALLRSGGESVEVTIGPDDVIDECEVDRNTEFSARLGVITYGVTPPPQPVVTVR